jgi:tetratricopeptide (TPR) repeat protein
MNKETSEIAKLTARISKDPRSKLFVPLAEEYKKAGDIDMAIYVLLEGLKSNPEYVTARSSLGKLLLTKGDLAGAQREFEEVVKTSPENLMAQKKLGDLLIHQNRLHDALPHYKIALSLSPDDGELASLISDVEAGRDVRSKIHVVKAKTSAERAPGAVSSQSWNVLPNTLVETPPASPAEPPAPITGQPQTPASSMTETEEPEEVLVVEPLEPETPAQAAGIVLSGEQDLPAAHSVVEDESINFDFPAGDQFSDEPAVSQDVQYEAELLTGDDSGTISTGVSDEPAAEEIVETDFSEAVLEQIPEPSLDDISGKSDDFTTDTLAELYISQGFFEKAVEIYERMLIDKPNSRGLQDKLSWVRAEVARTAAQASEQNKETESPTEQKAEEFVPVAEADEVVPDLQEDLQPQQKGDNAGFTTDAVAQAGDYVPTVEQPSELPIEAEVITEPGESWPGEKSSEENIFPEPAENTPPSEPKERTPTGGNELFNVFAAAPVEAPLHKDFEPREYVPPNLEQELPEPVTQHERTTGGLPNAGRKEMIARLETWLTTIKKEK